MRVISRLFVPAMAVWLLAGVSPSRVAGQTKVAVVDFQEALLETAEMQKAAADLEAKLSPRRDEIEKLQKELQEIQQKLQGATGGEAIGLQNDGQRKQREAQRKSEGLQADYEFERNEILQRGASKMRNAVAKLAEEKGLDLVVDIGNTLYFKPALDLTKEATAAYNQANAAASQ